MTDAAVTAAGCALTATDGDADVKRLSVRYG